MRIVHLADTHLGFRAYRKTTEDGQNLRERQVSSVFARAVDKIRGLDVDVVVIAGDVFDLPNVSNTVMEHAISHFGGLVDHCPVVIAGGNHDAPSRASDGNPLQVLREAHPGIRVVTDEPRVVSVVTGHGEIDVLVVPDHMDIPDDVSADILVTHAAVSGAGVDYADRIGAASIGQINPDRFAYVALGDYHNYTELAPNAFYPGSLAHVPNGPWDQVDTPRGFIVYDTETKNVEFCEVCDVAVHDIGPLPAVDYDVINACMEDTLLSDAHYGAIVRLKVTDSTPSLSSMIDRSLERKCKEHCLHFHLHEVPAEVSGGPAGVAQGGQSVNIEAAIEQWIDENFDDPGVDEDEVVAESIRLVKEAQRD